jgi:uncharacterized protein YdeI (YjbR/CyaY-like superfamily)
MAKKISLPEDFAKVLENNSKAKVIFENLPPTHQREYLEWIGEAKSQEIRDKRMEKAVVMITERRRTRHGTSEEA